MAQPTDFQTTVSTSAVALPGTQYKGFVIYCDVQIYLGDAGVTTGTGLPVPPDTLFSLPDKWHEMLTGRSAHERCYAIAGSSSDVRVLALVP